MPAPCEVAVTLSPELFAHLRAESSRLRVPMEWLVAALVFDTIDGPATTLVAA